ncbi:MAG: hypothetical protein AAB074_06955 [Planctomycetota bacterium]
MTRLWTWTIVAFWALVMALLFRDKVLPSMLQIWYPTYPEGLQHLEEEDYQMGIFLQGQKGETRIGTSRTTVSPWQAQRPEDTAFSIQDETTIDLSALGQAIGSELTITTTTLLDARYHVKTYDVVIRTGIGNFEMNGVVRDKTHLGIRIKTPFRPEPEERSIEFDSAMALATGLTPIHPPSGLRIGREWTVHRIDPLSIVFGSELKRKPLVARVERMEEIQVMGEKRSAFVVSLRGDRYEALAWVDEAGKILQERVPFGSGWPLLMRREPVSGSAK